MFNTTATVFVEVIEPNKAPDPRYITIGESDINLSDDYLIKKAINWFKAEKDYPEGTEFNERGIYRFKSLAEYSKFLEGQLRDWLNSEEE